MTDLSSNENCPRCGGNTNQASSGSITQWMVRCTCGAFSKDVEEQLIDICGNCNKRIGRGREGSFTQWIFRSDICSCTNPNPHQVSGHLLTQPQPAKHTDSQRTESFEPELEIDGNTFPVERYKPIAILGEGAAGSVYLCRDRMLAKKVAIKILKNRTPNQLVAFQKEAKAASKLCHPNVVTVQDFGLTSSGNSYMVMEFFGGSTLSDLLEAQGPLDEQTALSIFAQVCDGLSESHKNGIYHRDIKSRNILVSRLDARIPDVRIIDFGMAGVSSQPDGSQREQSETFVGTPQYMSPDQAVGLIFDARSEIYSVGCTLFEALTGQLPFKGATSIELVRQHVDSEPPTLAETRADLSFSQEVQDIVSRCLEKRQSDRFSSTDELADALRHALAKTHPSYIDEHAVSESETAQESPVPIAFDGSSRDLRLIAGSLVVVALLVIFGFSWTLSDHQTTRSPSKQKESDITVFSASHRNGKRSSTEDKAESKHPFLPRDTFQSVPDAASFRTSVDKRYGPIVTANRYMSVIDSNLAQLKGYEHIYKLELGGTLVTGTGLKYLKNTSIDFIDLWNTPINGEGLKQVMKTKGLKSTSIARSSNLSDDSFKHLASAPDLQVLAIGGTKLTENGLQYLPAMKKLSNLELSGYDITESGVDQILRLEQLETINFKHCSISEAAYERLRKLPHMLKEFELEDVGLNDAAIRMLSKVNSEIIILTSVSINLPSLPFIRANPKFYWRRLRCDRQGVDNRLPPEQN